MEKARDDYYHTQSQAHWDLLLQQFFAKDSNARVRRLVMDPMEDFFNFSYTFSMPMPIDFTDAIKYLLTTPRYDLVNIPPYDYDYYTVEFHELRPYLFEKRLSAILAAKGRRDNICPGGGCVFEYSEKVEQQLIHVCGSCDEHVDSGTPAYTCRLCILTLHKSCAERIRFKALRFNLKFLLRRITFYHEFAPEKHACKSCVDGGKGFNIYCGSCIFQSHLKCGLIPTIIYHNSHPPHFLSLLVTGQRNRCRACGDIIFNSSYCCKPCGLYYHLRCALLPLELLKHEHGGHEHVMKLMYSHHETDDDKEPEESYWCEVCYKDMDPQGWLYSCKDCPYYSAHLDCARGYEYLGDVRKAKFVPQIQSQLDDVMADQTNADSKISGRE